MKQTSFSRIKLIGFALAILLLSLPSAMAQEHQHAGSEAAGKCPALPHPIDRRQARRFLELARGRRRSHGPREHESPRSSVRARLEWQRGGRRPAVRHHDPRRDAAGRRGRNLHHQQGDGRLEEPHRRRHCELFGPRVLRVARRTDRYDGVVPGDAAGEA